MGQKINPIGLRLGINRGWDSTWFAKKKDFGRYLIEDFNAPDMSNASEIMQEDVFAIEEHISILVRFMDEMPDIISSPWYGFQPTLAISMDAKNIKSKWDQYLSQYTQLFNTNNKWT